MLWSSHTHGEMGSLPGACCRQSSAGVRPVLYFSTHEVHCVRRRPCVCGLTEA